MKEAPKPFFRFRTLIDRELRQILESRTDPLYLLLKYHLGWVEASGISARNDTGKLFRSHLCLLACSLCGGDVERALPMAASLELLHNFSLIHDDIQDQSELRRGRPTVWAIWGAAQAINAGDGMNSLSRISLLRLAEAGVEPTDQVECLRLLEHACLLLCEGQYLDIAQQSTTLVTELEYISSARRKTGALLACALESGAFLGGADPAVRQDFRGIGFDLGLAYQIQDDFLDN